jgi:tetratricopeptide (TPR) repeat protein
MSLRIPLCPYVGLQPYTEEDQEYFFGRDRDVRTISANLYAAPITIFYGASGVGKSSVLNAGVLPKLRRRPRTAVVVYREWQRPDFLELLKAECIKAAEKAYKKPVSIHPDLPLDELLLRIGQAFGGTSLILLDQFEEYFMYHPESRMDDPFESELARVVNRTEVDASVLIALREDGLAKLDRFRVRIPNLMGNILRLQHLDATSAEEAIRNPLDVYNRYTSQASEKVSIEDALVHEILSQVRSGRVSLADLTRVEQIKIHDEMAQIETPFLQLVLERLWKAEMSDGSHVLRLSTLERLKGAKEIVRTHLDEVMNGLPPAEQESTARIFQHLVTPSGTKIAHKLTDLAKWANLEKDRLAPIVKKLSADNRILRPIAPPPDQPEALRYEVFHDVLAPAVLDWGTRYLDKMEQSERRRRFRRRAVSACIGVAVIMFLLVLWALEETKLRSNAEDARKRAVQTISFVFDLSDQLRGLGRPDLFRQISVYLSGYVGNLEEYGSDDFVILTSKKRLYFEGLDFLERGDRRLALQKFGEYLAAVQSLLEERPGDLWYIEAAKAYEVIGDVHVAGGNPDKGRQNYDMAREELRKVKAPEKIADHAFLLSRVLSKIGDTLAEEKQYQKAIVVYEEARQNLVRQAPAPGGERENPIYQALADVSSRVNALAPRTGRAVTEQERALGFVHEFMKRSEGPSVEALLALYGDRVNYYSDSPYGKSDANHGFIAEDKRNYFRKWPSLKYRLTSDVEVAQEDHLKVLRFKYSFDAFNKEKGRYLVGEALNTLKVLEEGDSWKIVFERQKVLSREEK